jgi:K+-sensing histidine kinase KdpD
MPTLQPWLASESRTGDPVVVTSVLLLAVAAALLGHVVYALLSPEEILRFARDHRVTFIVLGQSRRSRATEIAHGSRIAYIIRDVDHIDVLVVADLSKSPFVPSEECGCPAKESVRGVRPARVRTVLRSRALCILNARPAELDDILMAVAACIGSIPAGRGTLDARIATRAWRRRHD